jgi:F0F1-type ATP synthase membrane subunit b/b'
MKEAITKESSVLTTQKTEAAVRHGVLPAAVHLAIDVADKSQSTAFALLQDARLELRTAVDHGIELIEKATAAAFRFSRKAVQRIDEATSETLASAERTVGGAVKSARETTVAATQLATTAVNGVTASA